jgi:hypothetical protein
MSQYGYPVLSMSNQVAQELDRKFDDGNLKTGGIRVHKKLEKEYSKFIIITDWTGDQGCLCDRVPIYPSDNPNKRFGSVEFWTEHLRRVCLADFD